MPESVVRIEDYAFQECTSLQSIVIPPLCNYLGGAAFKMCYSASSISFESNLLTDIYYSTFEKCNNVRELYFPSEIAAIHIGSIMSCVKLNRITFGSTSNLTSIGYYAFAFNLSLTDIILPTSVTTIDMKAFYGCSSLTSITIPTSTNNMYKQVFEDCSKLTIYTDKPSPQQTPSGWHSEWNFSNRPVFWNCTITDGYVSSINKTTNSISNPTASGGIYAPRREGYVFRGWMPQGSTSVGSLVSASRLTSSPDGVYNAFWTRVLILEPNDPYPPVAVIPPISISENAYDYSGQYNMEPLTSPITLPDESLFLTNRLRCGVIDGELTLSAKKENVDTAYLEYIFWSPISSYSIDLGVWSRSEGLTTQETTIELQNREENGEWSTALSLNAATMSLKDNKTTYTINTTTNVRAFRLIIHTNLVNNNNNRGRICIGDVNVNFS